MTAPRYDVFVSHNRLDKPWVRQFVKYLRACGLSVYFDEDSMEYGADTVTDIDKAIEGSAHVLLVISPSSLASRWVALEASVSIYADPSAQTKKIIPILLTPVPAEQITPSIRRLNRVDLTREDTREEALRRLLKQLGVPEEKMQLPVWPSLLAEQVNRTSDSLYRFCQPAQEWYIPRNEEDFIRRIQQSPEQSQNIVVTGRTGFGKSSFLTWFEREASARGDLVVKIRPASDQLADFYETIKQQCLAQLESLDVGLPTLKGVYAVDIDAILDRITTKTGKRLFILIDQFESLLPHASYVAAGATWRSVTNTLASQLQNPRVVWVFAVKEWYFLALFPSELDLKLVNATYISLRDLDPQQSTALVKRLASLTNVTISDPAIDLLVTKTGGRPLTLVLTFLVALEKSPKHLVIEYDYLDESQPWNEIFKADYDRLESRRQKLIVLALAHTRRELVSQAEIVRKVTLVDGCSTSDVEADLKRIDNDIGIITVDDGFVSFRHSAFGLYVDSKHYSEYPKTWSQPSSDDDKQTRDLDVFSADVAQRAIATILHNLGSRVRAGSIFVDRLKQSLQVKDLKKANDVAGSLEEWLDDIVHLLKQTNRLVIPYQRENESFILRDAIATVARRFSEDTFIKLIGLDSIGQSRVRGPQELIENVFTELFQNSIDANATRILVSVKKDPESPLINCQIEDDGNGIPGFARERIFDAFTSAAPGHFGMGLYFVKRVLESFGGAISLDSSGEKGTRFTLRFPMVQPRDQPLPKD